MAKSVPAAGGGRWVVVDPERLDGWLTRFAERHGGPLTCAPGSTTVVVTAADGAVADCLVPFPPLRVRGNAAGAAGAAGSRIAYGGLVAHATAERRVGVLLVRLGGYAVGVFDGTRLISSKVGSRPVAGRSAAGGSSQQRFARRREGQARVALAEAADVAATHLLPALDGARAVVVGGERRAIDTVLADPRLAPLRPLVVEPRLDVAEPRLKVLEQAPKQFRAVRIHVTDGPAASPGDEAGNAAARYQAASRRAGS